MVSPCLSQCGSDVAPGLGTAVIKYFCGHLKSQAGYLVYYEKKVDKLRETFQELQNTRNDIQRRAEAADRSGEIVDDVVTAWLNKVRELEVVVSRIFTELTENKRCFKGCCPNCAWRYRLGKEAAKRIIDVELLQQKGKFDSVSQPSPPPSIDSMPVSDFMAFSSTKDAMNKVLDAMRDDKKHLIGIYGMGGVGKTTLMDELGRQFSQDREFGTVVKVVVSQNPSIAQIRRDIAEELGMKLWGDGEPAARALATRLKKESKIVIMMDDIWARLELREIGIPNGDEHKGCKILFTTRTFQACQLMESHDAILVDVLTKEDSWMLFKSKVGDAINSPDLEPVAKKVADECGGLPLAIVVVGRALRGCNKKSVWEGALGQLKRSIPDELLNVEEQLFKSLELSYNYIKNLEMKLLFLFCCLFREDYEISEDELTRYAVGEGFLSNVYTLDEARRKVHLLVQDLIACCLLLSTDKEKYVKMHDVVRDVAVYIASKGDDCFFVKAGLGMRDWPESKALEVCKRISLMNNDIWALPDQPNCPKLLTLLLNSNPALSSMPKNFFQGMLSLTVLDLSDTNIESLPSSLAQLTNLGALRLDRCKNISDFSLIGKLKKLKILGLQKYPVNVLPEEIGILNNLKLLDLSHTTSVIVPPNLMSKLSWLEELFMLGCNLKEALFAQIGSLRRLAYLQVYISDAKYLSQDVETLDGWNNLSKFIIYSESDWYSQVTTHEKNLYLKNVRQAANWTRILLQKAEDLILDGCYWDPNDAGHFVNVKRLRLSNCSHIDTLLNTTTQVTVIPPNAFTDIEQLILANLENLKGIYQGELPPLSFNKLRSLDIVRCKKLVCIMPYDLLQRVHCTLETLSVNLCDNLCTVFDGAVLLPQLKKLQLTSVPNLTTIWSGVPPPGSLQKLDALQIFGSNKLEHLFSQESIQGHQNLFPLGTFVNLKELDVGGCSCLKHLFLPSLANVLRALEKLKVKKNQRMEFIIGVEDGVLLDKGAFPRLKELVLIELLMLESFYGGEPGAMSFGWPMLEYVKLELCSNMKRFPLGVESAPKLKKMHLGDDDDVEWFKGLEWEDATIPLRFEICKD